jgi:hypothetical protein
MNLVTPKAGAKHELLFNEPAFDQLVFDWELLISSHETSQQKPLLLLSQLSAGLKSLIDGQFHNPIRPVFVGYLQKGLKKYKGLPLVHRPGKMVKNWRQNI